jgi:hypothetical protein
LDWIIEKANDYAAAFTSAEDGLLADISAFTATQHPEPHMLSGHVQGRVLALLSTMIRPLRVLEIGTMTGYSALCLAEGMAENGILHTIEKRESDAITAVGYFNRSSFRDRIIQHVGEALPIIETLKEEWGFEGFAVSDWEDFIMLHTVHSTSPSLADAYVQAFNAGVDMSMVPLSPQYKEYCTIMVNAVKSGEISMDRLDDAVRRILRVKERLGLFERPVPTFENYPKFGSAEFQQASLNSALESITLLKNENSVLPLKTNQKVLISGPTSNNMIYLNGAWTHTWQGVDTAYNTSGCLTVKQAFEKKTWRNKK